MAYAADCKYAVGSVIQVDGEHAFKFSDGKDGQSRYSSLCCSLHKDMADIAALTCNHVHT